MPLQKVEHVQKLQHSGTQHRICKHIQQAAAGIPGKFLRGKKHCNKHYVQDQGIQCRHKKDSAGIDHCRYYAHQTDEYRVRHQQRQQQTRIFYITYSNDIGYEQPRQTGYQRNNAQ